MNDIIHNEEWRADCMKWRGRVLKGKLAHWCMDWDGLPVDETTEESEHCVCHDWELRPELSHPWRDVDGVVHGTDVYLYIYCENILIRRRRCDRSVVPDGEGVPSDGPVTCFGCIGAV